MKFKIICNTPLINRNRPQTKSVSIKNSIEEETDLTY